MGFIAKSLQKFVLAMGSLILCLVFCELFIASFDVLEKQRKTAHSVLQSSAKSLNGQKGAKKNLEQSPQEKTDQPYLQIHPYSGWKQRKGFRSNGQNDYLQALFPDSENWWRKYLINNLGYHSRLVDYRFIGEDYFRVGVFGGSVADVLSIMADEKFRFQLSKALSIPSQFLLFYNFAIPGFKQPQQLFALIEAFQLGVRMDLVLNLDGFNEVALGGQDCRKGSHPIFPSRYHSLPLLKLFRGRLSFKSMEAFYLFQNEKKRLAEFQFWWKQSVLNKSQIVQIFSGARILYLRKRITQFEKDLKKELAETAGEVELMPEYTDPQLYSSEGCNELIARNWYESSRLMSDVASVYGAQYVHFLQPNQYVKKSKPLSSEETKSAYQLETDWAQNARSGYEVLRQKGKDLKKEGVAFFDLTQVYSNTESTVYIDVCCHLNFEGNRILFKEITRILKAELNHAP